MPLTKACDKPFFDRPLAPFIVLEDGLVLTFDGFCEGHQPFRRVRTAVQQHVLHEFKQVFRDLFIDGQLAGIHDAHIETGLDGMIEKGRVHRFAHDVVAAERERNVADAAADLGARQMLLDPPRRLDKIHRIIVVLLDPGRHCQDVRIKNNIGRTEADLFCENLVRPGANLLLALEVVRLTFFVERHHDHGRPISPNQGGLLDEFPLAFLQADAVDDRLALDVLEPCLQHLPFGAVDHDGDLADIRFGSDEAKEFLHRSLRIQHALIHVDVDDLGAAFYLLPRHRQGVIIFALEDELRKRRRTGHIGPLSDVHEIGIGTNRERLEPAQAGIRLHGWNPPRPYVSNRLGQTLDVRRRRATASAEDVEPAVLGPLTELWGQGVRGFRKTRRQQRIRQPGVRMRAHINRRDPRQLFDERPHFFRAKSAIHTDAEQRDVRD